MATNNGISRIHPGTALPTMLGLLLLAGCSRAPAPAAVDLSSCLRSLTNVAVMAEAPRGRAGMVSTYDRSGGNSDWAVWGNVGEDCLVEIANFKGPGCVRRIWTTSVRATEWRFYFDGETEPRFTARHAGFFLGEQPPYVAPLVGAKSGGAYSYLPLPYARSLRIVLRLKDRNPEGRGYFHINYETFPHSTPVTSFPKVPSAQEQGLIGDVNRAWREKAADMDRAMARCTSAAPVTVAPGQTATLRELRGPATVLGFRLRVQPPPNTPALASSQVLRAAVLRVRWDGATEPSVEVPLGDFFGNAFYTRRYTSLFLGRVGDEFVCRFPMPFARAAVFEIANQGQLPLAVDSAWDVAEGMAASGAEYFHARWRQSQSQGTPFQILYTQGRGHYVGCYLNAVGTDGGWTILEGDECITVDGDDAGALRGTGLEDYFNGGWYYTGLFDLPLAGLVEKAPIRTGQYRLHLADRVAFDKSLSMTFEFGEANQARGYMSAVTYWYQTPPAASGSALGAAAERLSPADPLEPTALMAHLFELERAGLWEEAAQRCLAYVQKFQGAPWRNTVLLRAAAYRERTAGIDAARPEYEQVRKGAAGTPAASQAEQLLWFHAGSSNLLVGSQTRAQHKVYLDGQLLGEGNKPESLLVWQGHVAPGPHELTVELKPVRNASWISMAVRAHGTNFVTDASWECTRTRPAAWPRSGDDPAQTWTPLEEMGGDGMLPRMDAWQFEPNAFIAMQSGRQLYSPWAGWDKAGETAYVRRRFVIP